MFYVFFEIVFHKICLTYNLKKYLKFVSKKAVAKVIAMEVTVNTCFPDGFSVFWLIFRSFEPLFLGNENHKIKNNHSLEWLFWNQVLENIKIFTCKIGVVQRLRWLWGAE